MMTPSISPCLGLFSKPQGRSGKAADASKTGFDMEINKTLPVLFWGTYDTCKVSNYYLLTFLLVFLSFFFLLTSYLLTYLYE